MFTTATNAKSPFIRAKSHLKLDMVLYAKDVFRNFDKFTRHILTSVSHEFIRPQGLTIDDALALYNVESSE